MKGAFEGTATLAGTDLATGTAELDRLLAGQSTVSAKLRRSAEGLFLDEIALQARTLALQGRGVLRTGASDVTATLDFSDLSVLGAGYRGALSARAALREGEVQTYTLPRAPGRIWRWGRPRPTGCCVARRRSTWPPRGARAALTLDRFVVENPQVRARASGTLAQIDLSARLANTAILLPDFPGPVEVKGRIADQSGRYDNCAERDWPRWHLGQGQRQLWRGARRSGDHRAGAGGAGQCADAQHADRGAACL